MDRGWAGERAPDDAGGVIAGAFWAKAFKINLIQAGGRRKFSGSVSIILRYREELRHINANNSAVSRNINLHFF
jgi:hypothetical protein